MITAFAPMSRSATNALGTSEQQPSPSAARSRPERRGHARPRGSGQARDERAAIATPNGIAS